MAVFLQPPATEVLVSDPKKCAHPVCKCVVQNDDFGDYCSTHCKGAGEMAELRCECGHAACKS